MRENRDFISSLVTDEDRRTLLAASGDGSLTAVDLRQRKVEQKSDSNESELLSLAIVKVNGHTQTHIQRTDWRLQHVTFRG